MNESQIFTNALKLATPAERAAFLDEACAGNPQLRAAVEELLCAQASDPDFLEQPAGVLTGTLDVPAASPGTATAQAVKTELPGVVLGRRYKLLESIGEGGMGTVWMAQQTEPVKRLVAVKVIKPGMDSKAVLARFEQERQALALMDHPNIAKVHDAGTTAEGRPYFVMELVKGTSITRYCDDHQLTPRQRLELFVPVCHAVQHAHQKGIIHRDIKPSNVLVARYDDRPVPKVIDFGVAKAAGQQLTEQTLHTGFGAVVGTVEYMSPEQATFNHLDIDTRSDVYSLGVLLYELLAGSPPFSRKGLEKAGMLEMLRVIREQEPSRPSTKLGTADGLPTLAANRGTEPARLTRMVRGELDWIVMKALEKDRNRRYETANGFAQDVQRYLADEPVQACPPSVVYRLRKFVRRNKASLGMTAFVLAVVVALAGGAVRFGQMKATRRTETERAVTAALSQAETLVAEGEKQIEHPDRWRATARLALATQEKAEELMAAGEVSEELAGHVHQVRVTVDEAVTDSRLLVELDRIRLEQAAVKGNAFDNGRVAPRYAELLGNYGINLSAPESAAARVRDSRLRDALLAALADWSGLPQDEGERRRVEAVWQLAAQGDDFRTRWADAMSRRDNAELVKLANDPAVHDRPPGTLVIVARKLTSVKELAAAERLLREGQRRYPGDFWLNHDLGMSLVNQGRPRADEAVGYLRAALALRSDSPGVHLNLGLALATKGNPDAAIRCYRAALEIDPNYAVAHHNLGNALSVKKDFDGAIQEYRAAIQINPMYASAHNGLGSVLGEKGDREGAIREFQAALQIDPNDAYTHSNLGLKLLDKGDLEGAIRECRAAVQFDAEFAPARSNLGIVLMRTGDSEGAIAEFRAAIRLDKDSASAYVNLAGILCDQKHDFDAAINLLKEAIGLEPNDPIAHQNLGIALERKGRLDESVTEFRTALHLKSDFAKAYLDLGRVLKKQGKLLDAMANFREAIRVSPTDEFAYSNLGDTLCELGKFAEAEANLRKAIALKASFAEAHYNLGLVFHLQGNLSEAQKAYQEAIRLDANDPQAHCNLGHILAAQGQFRQAVAEFRLGHKLGSKNPQWQYPSAQWIRDAERMANLDARLPKILEGKDRPADAAERVAIAQLCQHPSKQLNNTAARFYAEAFGADSKLAEDLRASRRYNAACVAALAGCGKGKDAGDLDGKNRERLRRQALAWLRADLEAFQRLEKDADKDRPVIQQTLRHWQQDEDLAGVRGDALAKLPETERRDWQKLWQEVEELRKRAAERKRP